MLADRRLHGVAGGLVAAILVLFLVLAVMPWGVFKPLIERRLSDELGRPVTIARVDRVDSFSLYPTIAIHDLRAPQAAWAGTGDMARVARITLRVPVLPLLIGRFRPSAIAVSGARVALVRDAQRRENWRNDRPAATSDAESPMLEDVQISDTIVSYRDALRDRAFRARLRSDSAGFRMAGQGVVQGSPVTLIVSAPSVAGAVNKPWRFRVRIAGPALTMAVNGTMDRPLDTGHMTIDVDARAADLKMVDAIIEAGLFGTQPVHLVAHARHDGPDWTIDELHGLVGRSDVAGKLTVRKRDGRTRLDGEVVSNALSFDDFATDDGLAQAATLERTEGLRIVPNTRINIRKITHTDGTLRVTVRSMLPGKRPSSLTHLSGTITLDHQLMTISPFRVGLRRGDIAGAVTVDQRGGRKVPIVTLDLRLRNSSVAALGGGGDDSLEARLDGHVRLIGPGSTVREAVGASSGTIGMAGRNGSLPAKLVAMMGFDLARGLLGGEGEPVGLRCLIARFDVRDGVGQADPVLIDTTTSQSRATGTLRFPSEAIALTVTGAPKQKSILRLPGSVSVTGTLRDPAVQVPPGLKSVGNIFKGIWRSITGDQGPRATDADCEALVAKALR